MLSEDPDASVGLFAGTVYISALWDWLLSRGAGLPWCHGHHCDLSTMYCVLGTYHRQGTLCLSPRSGLYSHLGRLGWWRSCTPMVVRTTSEVPLGSITRGGCWFLFMVPVGCLLQSGSWHGDSPTFRLEAHQTQVEVPKGRKVCALICSTLLCLES